MSTRDEIRDGISEDEADIQRGVYAVKYFQETLSEAEIEDFLFLTDRLNATDEKRLFAILEPLVRFPAEDVLPKFFEVIKRNE